MTLNVEISAQEIRALLETGFLLWERTELDKAAEVFDGVLALRPQLEPALIGLANVRQAQGRAEEAKACFEEATKAHPASANAHALLGEFYHTQGQKDAALRELNKAIELDPSGPFGEAARAIKTLVDEGVAYTYSAS